MNDLLAQMFKVNEERARESRHHHSFCPPRISRKWDESMLLEVLETLPPDLPSLSSIILPVAPNPQIEFGFDFAEDGKINIKAVARWNVRDLMAVFCAQTGREFGKFSKAFYDYAQTEGITQIDLLKWCGELARAKEGMPWETT